MLREQWRKKQVLMERLERQEKLEAEGNEG